MCGKAVSRSFRGVGGWYLRGMKRTYMFVLRRLRERTLWNLAHVAMESAGAPRFWCAHNPTGVVAGVTLEGLARRSLSVPVFATSMRAWSVCARLQLSRTLSEKKASIAPRTTTLLRFRTLRFVDTRWSLSADKVSPSSCGVPYQFQLQSRDWVWLRRADVIY